MHKPISLYECYETYAYLRCIFNVASDWEEQVTELCHEYTPRLTLIHSAPLPIMMKIEAIRMIAVAKIQHLFPNVHIAQHTLVVLNNETVSLVRKWLGLYNQTAPR